MVDGQPHYEKDEKDEKHDEKEFSKHEEKTAEEKWRRDPLSALLWAAVLIWAGLVFLADNLGMLMGMPVWKILPPALFDGLMPDTWVIVLCGAGVIMLVGVVARLTIPAYRRPVGGELVLAAILFGVVLGSRFGWNLVWAFVLIAVGISVLLRSFTVPRR